MKTTIFFPLIFFCLLSQAQTFSWVDQFGGTLGDRISSMVSDATGNIYVTGQFLGTMDADPGPGVYNLTSAGGSDTFIAKLSSGGALLWARQIEGSSTYEGEGGNGIAVGSSGNVYITGRFIGAVDFDLGPSEFIMISTAQYQESCVAWSDVFILKLGATGDFIWAKQVGGNGNDEVTSIALGTAEEVFISGEYVSEGNTPVDLDPGAGTFFVTSINGSAAFMLKLDSDGGFLWAKQWLSNGISAAGCGLRDALFHPISLCTDANGNVFCTGDFGSTVDFDPDQGVYSIGTLSNAAFVMKLNGDGTLQWARALNNAGNHAYGKDLVVGSNGNVYSVGAFDGTIDFDPGTGTRNLKAPGGAGANGIGPADGYVWVLNSSGNYVWAGQLGGNTDDGARSIDLDGGGNIYITGEFTGTSDFNPSTAKNTLKSAGNRDVYVCKLTASGGYTWAVRLGGSLYEFSSQIDVDGSNNILTSGYFEGQADFDPSSSVYWGNSFGAMDGFVHKMTQTGGGNLVRPWSDEVEIMEATLFPNPAAYVLHIDFAEPMEEVQVLVYDLRGQLMLEKNHVSGRRLSLDISEIPEGMYMISITASVKRIVLPFVKTL